MIWHQVYFKVKINLNAYDKNKKGVYVVLKIVIFKLLNIMKDIGAPIGEL